MPRVVDGKFRLIETLDGGTDTVRFLAEHTGIRRQVELETLAQGVPWPGPEAERLLREARAMGSVSHAAIQSVVDSGTDPEGRPYVVYEALRGTRVSELLTQAPSGIGAVRAGRIVLGALEAIRAMHRAGVVVRGLGPENVVVLPARGDDDEPVKLRALERAAFLAEPAPPGEIPYTPWIAPEIRRGSAGLDPRCDIYSVGMMLRHLITGRTQSMHPVPDTARRAIERATAEDPDERFPDVDVLMQAVSLLVPSEGRRPRDEMPTPQDPLAADLHWLSMRRTTRHGQRTVPEGAAKIHLLPVLLTIEAIYRRLGEDAWSQLAAEVPGVDDLLPGSGNTELHLATGVPIGLFAQIVSAADAIAGHGDLSMLTDITEAVAHRGLRRLLPDLPSPIVVEALIDGFPYVWSRITRQGTAMVLERDMRSARLAVRDQAQPSLELSGFVAGVLRAAIRQSGVRECDVTLTSCEALGDAHDVFRVEWKA
ncbi:protein kinase domain-containing protein [Sandaracinus amylolyticus]|uniref:protein kinase domain-containing protein n=1 Tax=Sandaracinus amylolyticus TaxID=927083 RepID=UPI001F439DF8|nr:hypothetical protein [Sandaracinus amylolyticus]UJR80826.1 Serine/threonine protein kinase [Sandaracinus amylolyticus]